MGKPTGYEKNLESTPRQAFQQVGVQGYQAGSLVPYGRLLADCLFQLPSAPHLPANVLSEGLAATDAKQYSVFVRN